MVEQVKAIVIMLAPWVAGALSGGTVTLLVKKIVVKYVKSKVDEISATEQNKQILKELKEIKREINILRGKSE